MWDFFFLCEVGLLPSTSDFARQDHTTNAPYSLIYHRRYRSVATDKSR
jgi:hypothetical protein